MKVDGILILYEFLAKWKGGLEGPGWQYRLKKRGGKWNKYDHRVRRNVIFLGIQRIVPPENAKLNVHILVSSNPRSQSRHQK